MDFARNRKLKLSGFSYEWGLNEFAIDNVDQYVTQVMIKIDDSAAQGK